MLCNLAVVSPEILPELVVKIVADIEFPEGGYPNIRFGKILLMQPARLQNKTRVLPVDRSLLLVMYSERTEGLADVGIVTLF